MPKVELEPCPREGRDAIAAMFQLYVHDFSEQWAGTDRGELQDDGRFPDYPYLASYWEAPRREPFLVRVDGHLAGFVLVNGYSHSGQPLDYSVAEFFIVRKHRRGGVGRAAARAAIAARPGQWELAVARKNVGAQAFWRAVAAELADGDSYEESDQADDRWNGLIIRFRTA
jgi:predicted acetyltransferase